MNRAARLMVTAALAAVFAIESLAEPRKTRDRKKEGWTRNVEAGVHLTEGNRDASNARMQVSARGRGATWQSDIKLKAEIGRADGKQTRERYTAEASRRREFSERWYVSYRADALNDRLAKIDYRVVGSSALGWFALKDDRQELCLEAGPAGVAERKAGESAEAYPALRIAETYEARLTSVSRLLQGVEYLPELGNDPENYLIRSHVELRSALDQQLSLHVRLESDYANRPAKNKEKRDTVFSVSLSYSF